MIYSDFIKKVLHEASEVARSKFGQVTSTTKTGDNNQVLTEADIEIGNLIVSRIKQAYPKYNIIDEEAGVIDNNSEYTWVVDPIDGTSNFAKGLPHYGIMIGLLHNDTPIAGGIALPFFREICLAEKGEGAYCNGEKLSVSSEANLLDCLVAYGIDGHQEEPKRTEKEAMLLGDIVLSIRNLRTSNSAFDYVQIAKGTYGGLLNQTCKIWDNVAAQIIIEEAGGMYTQFDGTAINYASPLEQMDTNFTFCTASPLLHKQLQEIINKHH